MGFGVWGLGCGVWGFGLGVWGLGLGCIHSGEQVIGGHLDDGPEAPALALSV